MKRKICYSIILFMSLFIFFGLKPKEIEPYLKVNYILFAEDRLPSVEVEYKNKDIIEVVICDKGKIIYNDIIVVKKSSKLKTLSFNIKENVEYTESLKITIK